MRPYTTLFLLSSLDGKISTGIGPDMILMMIYLIQMELKKGLSNITILRRQQIYSHYHLGQFKKSLEEIRWYWVKLFL